VRNFLSLLIVLLTAEQVLLGLGLSTKFNNIMIENLKIGHEYNLTGLAAYPVKVKNTGEQQAIIRMEPVYPSENSLKSGFEVIPSTDWIKLSIKKAEVMPGEYMESDLTIDIPEEDKYLGKKYQVNIWSYISDTAGKNMLGVTPGIEGSLLFTIAPVKQVENIENINLAFEVEPREIIKVIGKKHANIGKVKIKNLSETEAVYTVKTITEPVKINMKLKEGYQAAETIKLSYKPETLKIKPNKSGKLKIYFNGKGKIKRGKYLVPVEIAAESEEFSVRKFVELYLEIK